MHRFSRRQELSSVREENLRQRRWKRIEVESLVRKFDAVDSNESFFALGDGSGFDSATAHSRPNQAPEPTAPSGRGSS